MIQLKTNWNVSKSTIMIIKWIKNGYSQIIECYNQNSNECTLKITI